VDTATLRQKEAAIWGDTNAGGAVRIVIQPGGRLHHEQFDKSTKSSLRRHEKCREYAVRATAFVQTTLPNREESRQLLSEWIEFLRGDLKRRAALPPRAVPSASRRTPSGPDRAASVAPSPPPGSRPGDRVKAVLLTEKTKKGGWKAKLEDAGLSGPIQNTADVPDHQQQGNVVDLILASISQRQVAFRWPTPEDEARAQRGKEN
jgi:CRISPR-associated protein Cmr6